MLQNLYLQQNTLNIFKRSIEWAKSVLLLTANLISNLIKHTTYIYQIGHGSVDLPLNVHRGSVVFLF